MPEQPRLISALHSHEIVLRIFSFFRQHRAAGKACRPNSASLEERLSSRMHLHHDVLVEDPMSTNHSSTPHLLSCVSTRAAPHTLAASLPLTGFLPAPAPFRIPAALVFSNVVVIPPRFTRSGISQTKASSSPFLSDHPSPRNSRARSPSDPVTSSFPNASFPFMVLPLTSSFSSPCREGRLTTPHAVVCHSSEYPFLRR